MFKVMVQNDEDLKFVPIMELAINDTYKKIMGARVMYGNKLIDYLFSTNQLELIKDAMDGKLAESNIVIDEETYKNIFG